MAVQIFGISVLRLIKKKFSNNLFYSKINFRKYLLDTRAS